MTKTGYSALVVLVGVALGLVVLGAVWFSLSARSSDARDAAQATAAEQVLQGLTFPGSWAKPVPAIDGCLAAATSRCWSSDLAPAKALEELRQTAPWSSASVAQGRAIPTSGGSYTLSVTVDGAPVTLVVSGRKVSDQASGGATTFSGSQMQALVNQGDE